MEDSFRLQAGDAEGVGAQGAKLGLAAGGEGTARARARVSRGSMMPSSHRRAVAKRAWDSASSLSRIDLLMVGDRLGVALDAHARELGARDDLHDLGGLRAAHDGGAAAGQAKMKRGSKPRPHMP